MVGLESAGWSRRRGACFALVAAGVEVRGGWRGCRAGCICGGDDEVVAVGGTPRGRDPRRTLRDSRRAVAPAAAEPRRPACVETDRQPTCRMWVVEEVMRARWAAAPSKICRRLEHRPVARARNGPCAALQRVEAYVRRPAPAAAAIACAAGGTGVGPEPCSRGDQQDDLEPATMSSAQASYRQCPAGRQPATSIRRCRRRRRFVSAGRRRRRRLGDGVVLNGQRAQLSGLP